MVALIVNIKDGVILFHVWLKKSSFQVESNIKEIYNLLVDSNKIQTLRGELDSIVHLLNLE